MQHDAGDVGHLVDDAGEQRPSSCRPAARGSRRCAGRSRTAGCSGWSPPDRGRPAASRPTRTRDRRRPPRSSGAGPSAWRMPTSERFLPKCGGRARSERRCQSERTAQDHGGHEDQRRPEEPVVERVDVEQDRRRPRARSTAGTARRRGQRQPGEVPGIVRAGGARSRPRPGSRCRGTARRRRRCAAGVPADGDPERESGEHEAGAQQVERRAGRQGEPRWAKPGQQPEPAAGRRIPPRRRRRAGSRSTCQPARE